MSPHSDPEREERARRADADFLRAQRRYYEVMGAIVLVLCFGYLVYQFGWGSL